MANFLMESSTPPSSWTAKTSYCEISNYNNNRMGIATSAMNELRSHMNFTQLRFHCSKQQQRTFHWSDRCSVPFSCYSFKVMDGDNSQLAMQCDKWGNDGVTLRYAGKWGHHKLQVNHRMYNHAAFVANKYHWVIVNGKWLCDDVGSNFALSRGDFWKIYVR